VSRAAQKTLYVKPCCKPALTITVTDVAPDGTTAVDPLTSTAAALGAAVPAGCAMHATSPAVDSCTVTEIELAVGTVAVGYPAMNVGGVRFMSTATMDAATAALLIV